MPIFAVNRDVTKVTKGLPCDALGVFDPILVRFGITAGRTFLVDRIDLGMGDLREAPQVRYPSSPKCLNGLRRLRGRAERWRS